MIKERNKQNVLSDKDFKFICQYVYNVAGIVLNDSKRQMVYRRLTRIVRDRGINSFHEYCRLLKKNPEEEEDYFINAITTNLTSFFRENHHFEYLANVELPRLVEQNSNERIRIWSSACSTGEEPYSIAITLHKALKQYIGRWNIKVLATDIDSNVLAKAKLGVFHDKDDLLSQRDKECYFKKGTGKNKDKVKANEKLNALLTFKQLNLLNDWPMEGLFDVIFCRNVVIYFDKSTQQELFLRYYEQLKPGGLLILGHSESLGKCLPYFENVERTVFRKPL